MSYMIQFLLILGLTMVACLKVTVQGFMSRQLVRSTQDSVWFNVLMFYAMTVFFLIFFTPGIPDGPTLLFALGAGTSVAVFQTCYALALKTGPVSLTVLITNFSVLITTTYGILAFGDRLYASQMVAIVLLVASMILSVNFEKKGASGKQPQKLPLHWIALAVASLVSNAGSGCFQRTFAMSPNFAYPLMENTFMVLMQFTAGTLSLIAYLLFSHTGKKEKSSMGFRPAALAYAGGIALILGLYQVYLLFCLANIEGTFFSPTYAGLQSLIMTLIGMILFHDKLSTRQKWGVACGILCVVLMNVRVGFAI